MFLGPNFDGRLSPKESVRQATLARTFNCRARWSVRPGCGNASFAARWLQSLPKPLGLMAANDERARQCAEACKVAGISVPSEVGIVGVDNDDVICGLSNPQLSSVAIISSAWRF